MFTDGTELRHVIRKNVNMCRIHKYRDMRGSGEHHCAYLYGDFDFENYFVRQYGKIFDKVYGLPIGEIHVVSAFSRRWLDDNVKLMMLFKIRGDKIKTQEDTDNYIRIKEKIKSEEIFMCEYEVVTYESRAACSINLYI